MSRDTHIPAEFARTLERELAAAIKERDEAREAHLFAQIDHADAECELAALRAQLEEAKGELERLTKMYGERTAAFASVEDMLGRLPSETVWDAIRRLRADPLKAASRPVESPTPQKVPAGELFDAADKLNDYLLEISNWPMKDIPDEIYGPFAAALKNAESAPPATASAAQGEEVR